MKITIIVAKDKNNLIGIGDVIPWRLSGDMKMFKETTLGHHIIMGRKTFETFPKPLPGRKSLIITRDSEYQFLVNKESIDYQNCSIYNSIDECLTSLKLSNINNLFVIGGGEIYKQFLELDLVDELLVTEVDTYSVVKSDEDVYFPEIDFNVWKEVSRISNKADEKNQFDYAFVKYQKIK